MTTIEISEDVFEKCRQLGTICTGIGSVWIAKHKPSSSRFVLKIYELENCQDDFDRIKEEILMVRQLHHRNIIKYLASFACEKQLWIVMPLIGYTSASRLVDSYFHDGLSEDALALVTKDVLCGLQYLHSKGIIHRSLKGSHILVDSNGKSLLCGFRRSTSTISQGKWARKIHTYPPEAEFNLHWASPELLKQDTDGYCVKTDIYSLGVTICELGNGQIPYLGYEPQFILLEKVYGREPFLYDEKTCHLYDNGKVSDSRVGGSCGEHLASLPKVAEKCFSSPAHAFVSSCLTFDPSERPSADKLLEHPFIRKTRKLDVPLPAILHRVVPIDEISDLGDCEDPDLRDDDENSATEDTWDLE